MKVKNANLEWKVLRHDFNTNEIVLYNVVGQEFIDTLHKAVISKKVASYEQLKEFIDRYFMRKYWCRAEHEIAVGGLFAKSEKDLTKIDIYTQLKMNLDRITEYVNAELKINF